jgi:hypothetical protein
MSQAAFVDNFKFLGNVYFLHSAYVRLNFSFTYLLVSVIIEIVVRGPEVSNRFRVYVPIFVPVILTQFFSLVFLRLFSHIPGHFPQLGHDRFLLYAPQPTVYCRGAQIPVARSPRRLNFVICRSSV